MDAGAAWGTGPAPLATAADGAQLTTPTKAPTETDEAAAPNAATQAPPRRPTAFQRFVEDLTGEALPIFGEEFFALTGEAFSSARNIPVPADYALGPGDEILVRMTGVIEMNLELRIDSTGRVVLPKVGPVVLAGVRAGELESFLTRQFERSFRNFTLTASLPTLKGIDVYVVGAAARPGKHRVSSTSSLVNALFAVGGPAPEGSMRRIQLVRLGEVRAEIDLYDFVRDGRRDGDVSLLAGDTIVIPPAGPQMALIGQVHRPAIYEVIPERETVLDVLRLQGGLPVSASPLLAHLERVTPSASPPRTVENFPLDAPGLARRLQDGDVLFIAPTSGEFGNTVTVRGSVAAPGRYAWKPGLRIRDLLPGAGAVVSAEYHRRKGRLAHHKGNPAVAPDELLDQINWDYGLVERLNWQDLTTDLIPFHPKKAILEGDGGENLVLQPGDVVTIFSTDDIQVPRSRRGRRVLVQGEVARPGYYRFETGTTLGDLLKTAGGLTADAYVFGMELQRETVRRAQETSFQDALRVLEDRLGRDLAQRRADRRSPEASDEEAIVRERMARLKEVKPTGRIALMLEPSDTQPPVVVLEDGDTVVVPARPSTVVVVGAVRNRNALLWEQGLSVEGYLERAGLSEAADRDAVFVVHANGNVSARSTGWSGLFGNQVLGHQLSPGDVVVVPERLVTESSYVAFVREMKDWSLITSNFAVASAVILNLIR
jgi:protein involved in polysaccharide export with SLBB domain